MAEKKQYVSKTGIIYLLNKLSAWISTNFSTKTEVAEKVDKITGKGLSTNDYTDAEKADVAKIATLIAEGGEPNKIEVIQLNGNAQTITNKTVNIRTPYTNIGDNTYSVIDESDNTILHFAPDSNYGVSIGMGTGQSGGGTTVQVASKDYVDTNGGKIDKIKIDDVEQTITNKEVSLDLSYYMKFVRTNPFTLSATGFPHTDSSGSEANYSFQFSISTNGLQGGYGNIDGGWMGKELVDTTYVSNAITTALEDITGIDFKIITELPATGVKGTIYLKAVTGGKRNDNKYEEYIWIDDKYELLGTTEIDLSDYVKQEDFEAITTAEIDEMIASLTVSNS